MQIERAIIHKQAWKGPIIDAYAAALLRAALRRLDEGCSYFNNDDVPEIDQPGDKTTVGVVFKLLMLESVIEPWRGNVPDLGIWGGMRRSGRKCNNGHRNQLYCLTNRGIAEAWLRRHGAPVRPRQLDLFEPANPPAVLQGV